MNSTTMDQIGNYWGMWGPRRSSSSSSSTASPIVPAWAAAAGGEPSWEEQAFERDAAAHLGGCVWPPRSYSCTFCQREFRSAQALGGHMNVHRRDRALLRQGGSPSPEAPKDQPQQQAGALLYRRAASSSPSTRTATNAAAGPPPGATSYLSAIVKESKNKLLMPPSMQAAAVEVREDQAIDQCDLADDDNGEESAGRPTKRRRCLDHPSTAALLIFVQPVAAATTEVTAATCESPQGLQAVDLLDAKVLPQTTIPSPSSASPPLVVQHEVDLELRLGTSPKVT